MIYSDAYEYDRVNTYHFEHKDAGCWWDSDMDMKNRWLFLS